MYRLTTALACIALCASGALAASRPAPRSLDRFVPPELAAAKPAGKVSGRLRAAVDRVGPLAAGVVPADPPRTPDGKLLVYVDCAPFGDEQLTLLAAAGVAVDGVDRTRGRVRGAVDAETLARVTAFTWVRSVRPVDRAVPRAVATEGDRAARADVVRAGGLDGRGVVVGVISDGIDSLAAAQQSGDLPGVTVPNGGCRRGGGDEGTALLEIVHDVAPGAQLLFAGPADSVEMVEAVQCLTAAGADVIVDDLGFFGEPYFEDGPVAAAVRDAVRAGVSYHSSAGNEAEEHYEAEFTGLATVPTVHDFGDGDNLDAVVVPPGGRLTCILQWNDPFGASSNDYDLFALDDQLNSITFSNDPQTGTEDPIEAIDVVNQTNADAVVNLLVNRFEGDDRRIELFCLGASAMEHSTAAGSIVGHPALDEVVAVGAIDVADPGLDDVEAFSSRGPARVDFPVRQDRAKPDVAAFDGVTISNAGGFPACPPSCAFFGTSAASPHTAGVAALLLQKDPSLTPADVQAALRAGAVDVGPDGFDDASGFGRLDAVAAAATVSPPGCASDAQCDDGDACTLDVCEASGACVSTPLAGTDAVACRLGLLGSDDVCAAGAIDGRTATVIGKRVKSAAMALFRATQSSSGGRRKLLARVVRQLAVVRRRVTRATSRGAVTDDCAATLGQLIETTRGLVRGLSG